MHLYLVNFLTQRLGTIPRYTQVQIGVHDTAEQPMGLS